MKKILTALLLVTSLSGVLVAAEVRDTASRSEANNVTVTTNGLHPTLLQRRRRWRRRWNRRRWARMHRNNGRRWNNRRWNNRRWNNRRRNRRGNMGGHDM
ncbi:MAG TPA: hypothetical protein VJ715_14305 [Pyrinomonadaceae bacterium]|nr:hypothetical protein [Pyrinomonadaceae bacterium]